MNENDFLSFLNTTTSKGGATFNMQTCNVSKLARDILANTPYKVLAKQHVNSNIVETYKNNGDFRKKLDDVMQELNITVIPPLAMV